MSIDESYAVGSLLSYAVIKGSNFPCRYRTERQIKDFYGCTYMHLPTSASFLTGVLRKFSTHSLYIYLTLSSISALAQVGTCKRILRVRRVDFSSSSPSCSHLHNLQHFPLRYANYTQRFVRSSDKWATFDNYCYRNRRFHQRKIIISAKRIAYAIVLICRVAERLHRTAPLLTFHISWMQCRFCHPKFEVILDELLFLCTVSIDKRDYFNFC